MSAPRFSILVPTRDRPEWIWRCMWSLLSQDFTDWEMVIYDNGEQRLIFHSDIWRDDPRVRYFRGTASGPADAFQKALDQARGEIVHPLADDDELMPGALATVDRKIGDAEWLVGKTEIVNVDGVRIATRGRRPDVRRLKQGFGLGGAVYWKRSLSDRLGGFDTDYEGAADYDLYLRFAKEAPAAFVDEVLYRHTSHPETDSRLNPRRQREASMRIRAGE